MNRPVNFNDPTGHMMDDGCKTEGCDGSKFSGIQILLKLGNNAKNENLKKYYYGKAMNKVEQDFGIALAEGYDFVYSGADPTDPDTYATTDLDASNDINIYDPTFATTAGDLAATMAHESCHVNQNMGTTCLTSPRTIGKRYSSGSLGYSMNEIEARELVLLNLDHYGNGLTYGITEEKVGQYQRDIDGFTNLFRFNADFMDALINQTYILPYGF